MTERIDIVYRRHRIIAGDRQTGPGAVVYDGRAKLYEADGPTVAADLEEAREWVDRLLDGQRANRRLRHVGTKDEYLRAFQALSLGKHHEAMLRAHANAPGNTLTATQLARAAGYESYETANAHYGRLGRQITDFLDLQPRISRQRKEPVWTCALAEGPDDDEKYEHGHWRWKMHPEVVDALRDLNMA